jgi:hypothetical protein
MRTVIYSKDFEPITVVDLPWMPERILQCLGGRIRLAALDPPRYSRDAGQPPLEATCRTVMLSMERLYWKDGIAKWIFIADCDETALLLEPSWLPGQQRTINEYERMRRDFGALVLDMLRRHLGEG